MEKETFDSISPEDLAEFGLVKTSKEKKSKVVAQTVEQLDTVKEAKLQTLPLPLTKPSSYEGDYRPTSEELQPLKQEGYCAVNLFPTPAHLVSVIKKSIREGKTILHEWQLEQATELANSFDPARLEHATNLTPYKLALCAANGSGKDYFVIAPFVIWSALTQIRCLTIITSSSGTQLTAQTENYIKTLAQEFNEYAIFIGLVAEGQKVFHIRQRYIRCNLTGAEIRMFATDEAGKAEGYHPLEPEAKMIIIVNEAKSVSEEIFEALTRCTGYSHWLNVSTPGEPKGSFYDAFCNWPNTRHVTTYDCPHLTEVDRADDRRKYGEHSPIYRSKHLALFTTIGGTCIISQDVVNSLLREPPNITSNLPERIGIDLAAGGDETVICRVKGSKVMQEHAFREVDTTVTAAEIEKTLVAWGISKDHENIYCDDGGIGHAINDMLVRRGWNIKRVLNQSPAITKSRFGNRGAELWEITKRVLEEGLIDISSLSGKTIEQLTTRQYKKRESESITRITLESKKEAKAHGRPSPDRADAFVLTFCGFCLDDFINKTTQVAVTPGSVRARTILKDEQAINDYYENNVTFGKFNRPPEPVGRRIYGSISRALNHLMEQ